MEVQARTRFSSRDRRYRFEEDEKGRCVMLSHLQNFIISRINEVKVMTCALSRVASYSHRRRQLHLV